MEELNADTLQNQNGSALKPVFSVIFSVLTIVLGFAVVGQLAGMLSGFLFYEGTFAQWAAEFTSDLRLREELKTPLLVLQAAASAIGLALMPWLFLRYVEKSDPSSAFQKPDWIASGLTIAAVLLTMVPNSVFIEWNSNLTFPGEWDNFIREREELAMSLTRFMTTFSGPGDFMIGLIVLAVLPALGEEIAFRGMLQPSIIRLTGNIHVGIWVTAVLFSAFHFQFLGFVPRLMLGALFGYIAAWSGNMWLPVLAHFINNGISALMIYLYQIGLSGLDPEDTESAPWALVIPATVLLLWVLATLRKRPRQTTYITNGAVQ